MNEAGFIQKQKQRKVVVLNGSSNVWSKCPDETFTWTLSYVFMLLNLLRRQCWFWPEMGWIGVFLKIAILRMITLQHHQKVLSILIYFNLDWIIC